MPLSDTPDSAADVLFRLLVHKGSGAYFSEPVTQLEHALQAAACAQEHTDKPHVILAALLHDIGHLLEGGVSNDWDSLGQPNHDKLGSAYLESLGFGTEITRLVENHVKAKRYLVTVDPAYRLSLSEASKQTFVLQGGEMWPDEIRSFEMDPDFDHIIFIRLCDEKAKDPGKQVADLEYYRPMIEHYLQTVKSNAL